MGCFSRSFPARAQQEDGSSHRCLASNLALLLSGLGVLFSYKVLTPPRPSRKLFSASG